MATATGTSTSAPAKDAGDLPDLSKARKGHVFTRGQLVRLDVAAAQRAGSVTTTSRYYDDGLNRQATLVTYVDCSHKTAFVKRDGELLGVEKDGTARRDPGHVGDFETVASTCTSPQDDAYPSTLFVITAADADSITLTRQEATGHPRRTRVMYRYSRTDRRLTDMHEEKTTRNRGVRISDRWTVTYGQQTPIPEAPSGWPTMSSSAQAR